MNPILLHVCFRSLGQFENELRRYGTVAWITRGGVHNLSRATHFTGAFTGAELNMPHTLGYH